MLSTYTKKDADMEKQLEHYLTQFEEKVMAKNNKKRSSSNPIPVPPPLDAVKPYDCGVSVEELLSDIHVKFWNTFGIDFN
jgi:hypothetical protein